MTKAREVTIQVRRASDTQQDLGIYIGGQRLLGTSYASNLGPDVLTLFLSTCCRNPMLLDLRPLGEVHHTLDDGSKVWLTEAERWHPSW